MRSQVEGTKTTVVLVRELMTAGVIRDYRKRFPKEKRLTKCPGPKKSIIWSQLSRGNVDDALSFWFSVTEALAVRTNSLVDVPEQGKIF